MRERAQSQVRGAPPPSFKQVHSGLLSRRCASDWMASPIRGCSEDSKKQLALQQNSSIQAESFSVPSIVADVLRSPGQPLDPATRSVMEPRFGHDFSQVRIHADTKAMVSAAALNALAYTVGHHVVFGTSHMSRERKKETHC